MYGTHGGIVHWILCVVSVYPQTDIPSLEQSHFGNDFDFRGRKGSCRSIALLLLFGPLRSLWSIVFRSDALVSTFSSVGDSCGQSGNWYELISIVWWRAGFRGSLQIWVLKSYGILWLLSKLLGCWHELV